MSASAKPPHPVQPVLLERGVARFRENAIVRDLVDAATNARRMDLNEVTSRLCDGLYTGDDYGQLMQLIGYSVSGYCTLDDCVPRETKARAEAMVDALLAAERAPSERAPDPARKRLEDAVARLHECAPGTAAAHLRERVDRAVAALVEERDLAVKHRQQLELERARVVLSLQAVTAALDDLGDVLARDALQAFPKKGG